MRSCKYQTRRTLLGGALIPRLPPSRHPTLTSSPLAPFFVLVRCICLEERRDVFVHLPAHSPAQKDREGLTADAQTNKHTPTHLHEKKDKARDRVLQLSRSHSPSSFYTEPVTETCYVGKEKGCVPLFAFASASACLFDSVISVLPSFLCFCLKLDWAIFRFHRVFFVFCAFLGAVVFCFLSLVYSLALLCSVVVCQGCASSLQLRFYCAVFIFASCLRACVFVGFCWLVFSSLFFLSPCPSLCLCVHFTATTTPFGFHRPSSPLRGLGSCACLRACVRLRKLTRFVC